MTAYLVAWLDFTRGDLPVVVEVGVYSEESPTTTSFARHYPVEIARGHGKDYMGAKENLRRYCSSAPYLKWALPHFDKP